MRAKTRDMKTALVWIVAIGITQAQPVFTAAQAAAGRAAYEASCTKCHTEALTGHDGTGEIPELLKPYKGKIPPLAGTNAAFDPFLLTWGARTTDALVERVQSATRAFPPPGARVDDELFVNLTAYILQRNGAQAGGKPLTTATSREIRAVTSAAKSAR